MFFCAISGSPPTVPVVSTKSGHVYEKNLIEQYIEQNGTDPMTNEPLTKEDLIDVKAKPSTLPPRTPQSTSIPSLLTSLQSEYDSIILESLELKKAYQASRQELANALYREDAGVRALGRLLKERDEARLALGQIQASIGSTVPAQAQEQGGDVEMKGEEEGSEKILPDPIEQAILDTTASLSAVRRKRKPAPGYVKADNVRTFVQSSTVPSLHSTKPAGITALDLCVEKDLVLTGGADKTVQVFDLSSEKTLKTLKGHTKVVNHVEFVGGETSMLISSSADKTVKVWQATSGEENDWALGHNYTGHKGEIAGFAVHPSRKFFAIGSADSTWSLRDLETTETIKTYQPISSFEGSFGYSSFGMHPDGVLFCGGTQDGKLRIWDARDDKSLAASLDGLDGNPITTLSFSENGYYLAAGSKTQANVDIFDLRKLNLQASIAYGTSDVSRVNEVRFDPSAQFLSVAGTELKLYANKTWEEVVVFDDNAAELTAARWGRLGEKVVLAGMDRTLRVLSGSA